MNQRPNTRRAARTGAVATRVVVRTAVRATSVVALVVERTACPTRHWPPAHGPEAEADEQTAIAARATKNRNRRMGTSMSGVIEHIGTIRCQVAFSDGRRP